jgi:quercetin dioxygenase-like cupin family protein
MKIMKPMKIMKKFSGRQLAGMLAVLFLASPIAATQTGRADAQGFIRVAPEDVSFGTGTGMQSVVIVGDPTKPGIYVLRNKFPPGQMSRPHFHNQDRFVTVIKGTWWTASGPDGDTYNPDKTIPLKAGSFMLHPANGHHYDGAKDEEVIVQIMGMGPVVTTQLGR